MATRKFVLMVCDLCGKDENETQGIETHSVTVDGQGVEAEACLDCWGKAVESFVVFAKAGRPAKGTGAVPGKKRRRRLEAVS